MKILICSLSVKNYRDDASLIVMKYLEQSLENCTIKVIDTKDYINPVVSKLNSEGSLSAARHAIPCSMSSYSLSDIEHSLFDFNSILNDMMIRQIGKLIDGFVPNVILATHPMHLYVLSKLKANYGLDQPIIALINKPLINGLWIYEFVDAYLVTDRIFMKQLINLGVHSKKILNMIAPPDIEKDYQKQAASGEKTLVSMLNEILKAQ